MREIVFCVQPSGFPVLVEGVGLEPTSLVRVSPSAQNLYHLDDPSRCRDFHPAVLMEKNNNAPPGGG